MSENYSIAIGNSLLYGLASRNLCFRPLRSSEVGIAHDLEMKSFPADEAASLPAFLFRQREAGSFFWAAFDKNSGDLVGHVCGTLCHEGSLTHETMDSHDSSGNTLCIHSVAVQKIKRRTGIASLMLNSYIHAISYLHSNVSKVLLLSKANLLSLYSKCGFQLVGLSSVVHGTDSWFELSMDLNQSEPRKVPWLLVDAFSSEAFKGNPAAVFFMQNNGNANWMQSVAFELNQSETAFVERIVPEHFDEDGPALFELRWFTPTTEVDLCGHATLAAAHALWLTKRVGRSISIHFSTLSGILHCSYNSTTEEISLNFPEEPPKPLELSIDLHESIGVDSKDVIYFGRNRLDLIIEVSPEAFDLRLHPDFERLKNINISHRGVIVTALCGTDGVDFRSRSFFPKFGIPEDPVTGSAHCCLARYWADKLRRDELVGFQASKRGGFVRVQLLRKEGRVLLSGKAVTVSHGKFFKSNI